MVSKEYSEAAVEVLDILNHTERNLVNKIPHKFIEFLKKNSSKDYIPNLDHTKKIKDMKLKPKTEAILGLIYLKYWADEEGKKRFEQKVKENEKFFSDEFKTDFNNGMFNQGNINNEDEKIQENKLPKEYDKVGFLSNLIAKIKKWFRR